ncbi:MAG: rRNA (cytidine-2'-O-)-methyltransferase [Nitrospira sp. WS238]|nr:rRNA (cytidine-2'-O-)-methyltransferase [Nitrospira sp. WS238]
MAGKRSQQNLGPVAALKTSPARSGRLYVVGVPIGDPDDMTVRGIQVLQAVDLIASEDPRATQRLLAHHHIQATVTSYGPYQLRNKVGVLLERLHQGADVALVSDCGSPLIADPGHLLVKAAHAQHIPVVTVPGPSAVIAALTATGFPCDSFFFFGHLPVNPTRIARCLTTAMEREVPTVIFCTVASVARALGILSNVAPRCRVVLSCDLTRSNERVLAGTARQVNQKLFNVANQDLTLILAGTKMRRRGADRMKQDQSLSSRRIKIR